MSTAQAANAVFYAGGSSTQDRIGSAKLDDVLSPAIAEAGAGVEAPTGVSSTEATLHGSVEPGGVEVSSCVFEYGTEPGAPSQSAPCQPVGPYTGSTPIAVSAQVAGLQPATTYHYRIAATEAGGTVYSAEQTFATHGPPSILEAGVGSRSQTTASIDLVFATHGLDTHYKVEYGASASYGSTTASVDVGSEEVVNTTAEITELSVDTPYHYRVVASNAEGTVETADHEFTTDPIAVISHVSAFHVSSSSVTLSASPGGYEEPLTYRFEYGATASYGSSTPSKAVGLGYATAFVSELQPTHLYHFRIVVESEFGTVYGPDATFTTTTLAAPPQTLPDDRGYEKVSPNDNAEGNVIEDEPEPLAIEGGWTEHPFVVSADGSAVAYMGDPSEHGGTGQEGGGDGNQYVATRIESGGWVAQNVEPPSGEKKEHPEYEGFSPDLSVGYVEDNSLTPLAEGAPAGKFSTIYARTFSTGSYYSLLRSTPPNRSAPEFGPGAVAEAYAGSSANGGHALFMANDALTSNAIDGGSEENNLYDTSGGATTLVNVLPDGGSEPNAVFGGPGLHDEDQPVLAHDISEDGNRIFWTDLSTHDLYVRENDTAPQSPLEAGKCTVSADACTILIAEEAQYWNATPDGSRVLYTKGGDLYESDVDTGETEDLAPHAGVAGVLAASTDFSYVYFVARAALAPGAEPVTCVGGEGTEESLCDLYVAHTGDPLRFIGALSSRDNYNFPEYSGDWDGNLGRNDAEATPDGTHLMFSSKSQLTGYENNYSGQIFIYDYPTNEITCVSCNPDGEAIENALSGLAISAYLPASHVNTMAPHLISDDGNRVFFDTLTSLVPQDTNKKTDVYEWERDGTGSCTQSPGCIYLLSDGTSSEGSFLIGASTSGDDVFFTTRGKLVSEDENENIDVYDARVDAFDPPAPTKCTGTGCQGEASLPPVFATPPSTTYNGVGNLEPVTFVSTKASTKPLTRAEKLTKALKTCRKKPKKKRAACEKQARGKFGAKTKKGTARHSRVKKSSGRGK